MFKTPLILLIISSMLIPTMVFAGGFEVHSEIGATPGDPGGGGDLGPAKTPDDLTPAVNITFVLLPVPSNSWFVYNLILIPIVVEQEEYSKNTDQQKSYLNQR